MADTGSGDGTQFMRTVIRPCWGRWLTTAETSARLDWSPNTVYRYLQNGGIPGATMRAGRWYVAAWKLESWLHGWWDPHAETWEQWAERNGLGDIASEGASPQ